MSISQQVVLIKHFMDVHHLLLSRQDCSITIQRFQQVDLAVHSKAALL